MKKKAKQIKVPVSERALVARINRKLAHQGEKLFRSRRVQMQVTVGDFYVVDLERNTTPGQAVDLESLAKELGALKPYEKAV
jgi:hypothetical protein